MIQKSNEWYKGNCINQVPSKEGLSSDLVQGWDWFFFFLFYICSPYCPPKALDSCTGTFRLCTFWPAFQGFHNQSTNKSFSLTSTQDSIPWTVVFTSDQISLYSFFPKSPPSSPSWKRALLHTSYSLLHRGCHQLTCFIRYCTALPPLPCIRATMFI